jgi:DNA polymerase IV
LSRWIACIHLDWFAAELMRQRAPGLGRQPLVLVSYRNKRPKIAAVSADAAASGAGPGLTLSRTRGLCPNAQHVPFDDALTQHALSRLLETLWRFSNRVEVDMTAFPQSAVCYVDLGSLREPDLRDLAADMVRAVRDQMRLPAAVGVAEGKLAARLAAGLGDPLTIVPRAQERDFIAPHPADCLPLSKEAKRRLALLGLYTIGQFTGLPSAGVLAQFGRGGRLAHQLARGLDGRPVLPQKMPHSETAQRSYDDPVDSAQQIERIFHGLAQELEKRLHARAATVHELGLMLAFDDGTSQHECLHLLEPVSLADNIARVLDQLVERMRIRAGIVGIEVHLAHLTSSHPRQLELFTRKSARTQLIDLTQALARRYPGAAFLEAEVAPHELLPERRIHFRQIEVS